MKRKMLQIYVEGSKAAVPFYQKAFDASLLDFYLNEDGTYYHSELMTDLVDKFGVRWCVFV